MRAFGVSYEGKCSQIYAFLSEDGLIQWQPQVDDCINNICFDLGSSIVLSRALVSLKSEIINTFYLEFAIDGVEVVVSQTIDSSDGRIVVDFPKETMGRFLTVSGYKSLSDMQAISFISVFLQVE